MRDYKARRARKGEKSPRSAKSSRIARRQDALAKRFPALPAPPQTPPQPGALRRALVAVRGVPVSAVLITGGLLWLAAGLAVGGVALLRAPLEEVVLAGNAQVRGETVLRLARLEPGLRLSDVDPFLTARALRGHPRIVAADARRVYPARLLVRVRERQPELRVRLADGRSALLDADDVVLSLWPAANAPPAGSDALPLVTGVPGPAELSQRKASAALRRGRSALVALRELGYPEPERVVIGAAHPLLLRLDLPDGNRLLVARDALETGLRAYRALAERAPDLLSQAGMVDLTPLQRDGAGRIVLRPR